MIVLVCNIPNLHPFNIYFLNFSFSQKLYFSYFFCPDLRNKTTIDNDPNH
jgi:hypothetical protein